MNIFLFCGEDSYSSHKKLELWQKQFRKKYGEDSDIEIIEAKKLNPPEFLTNIEASGFFSEKRLIIVRNFLELGKTDAQKRIAEGLGKAADSNIIVFHEDKNPDKRLSLYKKIKKLGKIEEFQTMNPGQLTKWILDQAKLQGLKIDFSSATYLANHCKPDLWQISGELEKLKAYANGSQIDSEIIEKIVPPSLSASVFKLTDQIATKNSKQAIKTLNILSESGEDLIKVFFMIVRHFRILIQVKDLLNKGEKAPTITKKLKQHPFVIQKSSQQCRNFQEDILAETYQKLLNIDRRTKSGKIQITATDKRSFELELEKLIIDCCR